MIRVTEGRQNDADGDEEDSGASTENIGEAVAPAPLSPPPSSSGPRSLLPAGRINLSPSLSSRIIGDAQAQLGRTVSQIMATSGMFSALDRAREGWLKASQIPVLTAMQGLARFSTGPSLFAGTITAQLADAHLQSLTSITSPAFKALHYNQFAQLSQISRFVEQQNVALAAMRPPFEVSQPVVFATQAWRSVIEIARPDMEVGLAHLQMTARGTRGAIEAGILLSEQDEGARDLFRAEASATFGPSEANLELRLRLGEVHPALRDRLDGAWERIQGGGADAAGQAANSLMEVVSWTLRTVAPDDEVLAWHAVENRPASEVVDGHPTRALRARYAVRDHLEKRTAADLFVKSIGGLCDVIQEHKHSIETGTADALAPVALLVEGLLHYLVVD